MNNIYADKYPVRLHSYCGFSSDQASILYMQGAIDIPSVRSQSTCSVLDDGPPTRDGVGGCLVFFLKKKNK